MRRANLLFGAKEVLCAWAASERSVGARPWSPQRRHALVGLGIGVVPRRGTLWLGPPMEACAGAGVELQRLGFSTSSTPYSRVSTPTRRVCTAGLPGQEDIQRRGQYGHKGRAGDVGDSFKDRLCAGRLEGSWHRARCGHRSQGAPLTLPGTLSTEHGSHVPLHLCMCVCVCVPHVLRAGASAGHVAGTWRGRPLARPCHEVGVAHRICAGTGVRAGGETRVGQARHAYRSGHAVGRRRRWMRARHETGAGHGIGQVGASHRETVATVHVDALITPPIFKERPRLRPGRCGGGRRALLIHPPCGALARVFLSVSMSLFLSVSVCVTICLCAVALRHPRSVV